MSSFNSAANLLKWTISEHYTNGMNILGLVVAGCVIGIAIGALKEDVPILLKLFQEISHLMMKITGWVIW